MIAFKNILLPIDFSDHCDRAAEYAAWFAQVSGATVHIAHVVGNPADPIYEPEEVPYWVMVEHSEAKARTLLEQAARRCLPAGTPIQYHLLAGDPYEKLLELATRIQPDVIVMSSHGRDSVKHLLLGSVAEKMVRHATCPIFMVRQPMD
jgi:nucleotide-binding universal stress UspA family protein